MVPMLTLNPRLAYELGALFTGLGALLLPLAGLVALVRAGTVNVLVG